MCVKKSGKIQVKGGLGFEDSRWGFSIVLGPDFLVGPGTPLHTMYIFYLLGVYISLLYTYTKRISEARENHKTLPTGGR